MKEKIIFVLCLVCLASLVYICIDGYLTARAQKIMTAKMEQSIIRAREHERIHKLAESWEREWDWQEKYGTWDTVDCGDGWKYITPKKDSRPPDSTVHTINVKAYEEHERLSEYIDSISRTDPKWRFSHDDSLRLKRGWELVFTQRGEVLLRQSKHVDTTIVLYRRR